MKIAIVSDSHDNLATIKKALAWINRNKITTLIHCGDVCAPGTLKEISKSFKGAIHLILGNIGPVGIAKDPFRIKELGIKNVKFYGKTGELKIDGKRLAFVHEPAVAEKLTRGKKYDLVFFGHTHQPWEKRMGECRLVNPGTLSGMFSKATFAVYDTETDKLELKLVERL
ncbi:MAG: YfcE family phosphodiesterase [bacterium]|nr:YfcE family phosphodiesterase [bacterium]